MFLLDTGVLFAAVFEAHQSHEPVSAWLKNVDRFSTCGMTQIGAFRLLLNDAAMDGGPLDPSDAHAVLEGFVNDPRHVLLSCPPISRDFVGQTSGHRACFDDYLVQIARAGECRLATLDKPLATRWKSGTFLIV
jgi:predicted nucleic acid-binding protein